MGKQKYLGRYRQLTVYYGFTKRKYRRIPVIRLAGDYLSSIGFDVGDKLSIELETRKIIITKI
jgi:hypothetical protein